MMHEGNENRRKRVNDNGSSSLGLVLGGIGLAAGTAWCLKSHTGKGSRLTRRSHSRLSSDSAFNLLPERQSGKTSHQRSWLIGALGAGLAGAVLGTAGHRTSNTNARRHSGDVRLASEVTINRSPEEVYQYWRNFQNLPRVMSFIERVEPQEGKIYHWVARGPVGPAIEWDAEVVDDDPGKLLAWRSLEGSELQTWGTVIFRPRQGNRGTELSVAFNFCPSGRASGAIARYLAGLENTVLDKNLRNLKAQLEAGEISSSRRFSTAGDTTKGGAT
jgi:uncharacterized membrane protein